MDVLKNGTAKALGVSPVALKGFAVTGTDGKACAGTGKPSSFHARRARTLQAQAGLTATFAIVARDDATANRVATSANSPSPIIVPAVQKAATTVTATTKNAQIAQTAPTLPPKVAATPKASPAAGVKSGAASALTVRAILVTLTMVVAMLL